MKRFLLFFITATIIAITGKAQLTQDNASRHYAEFKKYFTDSSCSELASPYDIMTDEQLLTTLGDTPQELIDIALKVKNNAWAAREKEFRVAEYEPHNNEYSWGGYLKTNPYSYLQRPTGITATTGDTLLIFVDDRKSGYIKLTGVKENEPYDKITVFLNSGLNVVTIDQPDMILFINYAVTTNTTETSKKLSDYPTLKIHIEGGNVNGYFDVKRHTDEDWRDMLANHFKHYSVQVKGERVLFHMVLDNIKKVCPETITDAIGWWDECVKWQHELMGVDKYYDRFNSLLMARDGFENKYMYATYYYTYYEHGTLESILPWATVYANTGQMWGPAHEIGHINQGAIKIISTTETSNNLFSNVQIHRTGKTTTRGVGLADCIKDFNNKVPFPLRRDAIGKSRLYFQLYLYFHVAGKDETFYPRLFEALRKDPLINGATTNAVHDQLKFAEKCCEIAQMDLSEFFEAWGFFEPMNAAKVEDYGTYYVTLTEDDANASRKRMQQYEKKGGHLIFIEDRIKPSKRTDGVEGYRLDFDEEFAVGKMGETGQWEDYIDETVKAEGYSYTIEGDSVKIKKKKSAKGALGFKVYDTDNNKLLAFNNKSSIKLPTIAKYFNIKVVASQADGTEYEIPLQKTNERGMLIAKLKSINSNILQKTTNGYVIGRYYEDAIKDIYDLYLKADLATKKFDESEHTYQEWNELLDKELEKIKDMPNARAYFENGDVYNIINNNNFGYYMCKMNDGMKAVYDINSLENASDLSWMIEKDEENDCIYIKNKDGKYINDIRYYETFCEGESKEDAISFKANFLDDGNIYFTTTDKGLYLSVNNEQKIVGTRYINDNCLWSVYVEEKNSTAIEELESDAKEEISDVKDVYDLQGRKVEKPVKGIYIINGKKYIR